MRILFITSTRIGDAVLSTGILNYLITKYPEARFTIACGPVAASLFEAMPQVETVHIMVKRKHSLHWVDLWKKCIGTWWHSVVDLRNAPLTFLLGTFRPYHLIKDDKKTHRVELFSKLLKLSNPQAPVLWCKTNHDVFAKEKIEEHKGPYLAIGPTANWRAKTWAAEHFLETVKKIIAKDGFMAGAKVVLLGHVSEREQVQPLIDGLSEENKIDLIGDYDLPTVFAFLKRCHFYIGNDSGLMHMAGAAQIPTLGLFGPTHEYLYGPWGEKGAFVRTKIEYDDLFGENFDHRTSGTLMDSLSVDMVYDAAEKLWNKCYDAE